MKVLKFDITIFERRALAEVIEAVDWFESTGSRSKFKDWDDKYGKIIEEMEADSCLHDYAKIIPEFANKDLTSFERCDTMERIKEKKKKLEEAKDYFKKYIESYNAFQIEYKEKSTEIVSMRKKEKLEE